MPKGPSEAVTGSRGAILPLTPLLKKVFVTLVVGFLRCRPGSCIPPTATEERNRGSWSECCRRKAGSWSECLILTTTFSTEVSWRLNCLQKKQAKTVAFVRFRSGLNSWNREYWRTFGSWSYLMGGKQSFRQNLRSPQRQDAWGDSSFCLLLCLTWWLTVTARRLLDQWTQLESLW